MASNLVNYSNNPEDNEQKENEEQKEQESSSEESSSSSSEEEDEENGDQRLEMKVIADEQKLFERNSASQGDTESKLLELETREEEERLQLANTINTRRMLLNRADELFGEWFDRHPRRVDEQRPQEAKEQEHKEQKEEKKMHLIDELYTRRARRLEEQKAQEAKEAKQSAELEAERAANRDAMESEIERYEAGLAQPANNRSVNNRPFDMGRRRPAFRGVPLVVPSLTDISRRSQSPPPIQRGRPHRLAGAPPLDNILNDDMGIPVPETGSAAAVEVTDIQIPCIICASNQIQTVNFPCMHACFCVECASPSVMHSNICPVCRVQYMHISMLYLQYKETAEPPSKRKKIE